MALVSAIFSADDIERVHIFKTAFSGDDIKMIKGAIFDLDGTLLDSMFIWDTIGEDYLRTIGYEPKEKIK